MRILNFGSLNIDHIYRVEHIVSPGETIAASSLSFAAGGKGLNQSIALAKSGLPTYHAGSIGHCRYKGRSRPGDPHPGSSGGISCPAVSLRSQNNTLKRMLRVCGASFLYIIRCTVLPADFPRGGIALLNKFYAVFFQFGRRRRLLFLGGGEFFGGKGLCEEIYFK